ncbi:hypothetical protein [Gymnodinialimonas sp.]
MTTSIYGMNEAQIFRLDSPFVAIKDPTIRQKFLRTVKAWALDQWSGANELSCR